MTQDKQNQNSTGRGSNAGAGGLDRPVDTNNPLEALTAQFNQLRKEVTAEQDAAQKEKDDETKRLKLEADRQKRIDENEVKRLKREGDGTSWSGTKIFDNIWGKWYFKGQPVKVAKYENQFGSNISNLSLVLSHA